MYNLYIIKKPVVFHLYLTSTSTYFRYLAKHHLLFNLSFYLYLMEIDFILFFCSFIFRFFFRLHLVDLFSMKRNK